MRISCAVGKSRQIKRFLLLLSGGYNHLRSPVCQDESQRDETSPPPHSHSTQPPTSHSSTPNSNNNNNNNNNANNAYIHLRNLNQLKTECEYSAFTCASRYFILRYIFSVTNRVLNKLLFAVFYSLISSPNICSRLYTFSCLE